MKWYELGCGDRVSACDVCGISFRYNSLVENCRELNMVAHPLCLKKYIENQIK